MVLTSQPADEFDFVFSNRTASDELCLQIRAKLTAQGIRVWQQKTNIPKDSDNCTPSAPLPGNAGLHECSGDKLTGARVCRVQ